MVTTFYYLAVRISNIIFENIILAEYTFHILLPIYKQTMLSILDCGSTVWHKCRTVQTRQVEKLQNRALRIILHEGRRKYSQDVCNELNLMSLHSRRCFLKFLSIFRILHNLNCPDQLKDTFQFRCCMHNRDLRDKTLLDFPKIKSAIWINNIQVCWCKRLDLITCKH